MSERKIKKIGFFVSLMILVGSVVGIGIFFKNSSIAKATNNNGIAWLLAWIIGGLISIGAALSFAEIGSFNKTRLAGLSSWAYKVNGIKAGYSVSLLYSFFYYGILVSVLGIFGSEIFFFFLSQVANFKLTDIPFWVIVVVGLIVSILFFVLNHISLKVSGYLQTFVTIVKFLPLIVAVVAGIFAIGTHNNGGRNAFEYLEKSPFGFKGIIIALPAVLFSYDAFLVSGSIRNKMKNPSKNLPLVILVGMASIVILYTLIAVSSILHQAGLVWNLLQDSLPKSTSSYIVPIVVFFILISTLGIINGLSVGFIQEIGNSVDLKIYFGSKALVNKFGKFKTELIYTFIFFAFWAILILVPAIYYNSDSVIDGVTNFPTLFFFVVYAYVIGAYALKRKDFKETKKINSILFYGAAIISILGIIVSEVVYLYLIIEDLSNSNFSTSWGLFYSDGKEIYNWVSFFMYSLLLSFCIGIVFANFYLEKLVFKRNILDDMALEIENIK
ncbi:APC family permease [Mesomycoplasma molare]|uniref:Amino acid permease n=1 Tax=Mesomycoplasma molare TaxID=171288 RepID=A0ABY5TUC4_9BACT|nr:amino acid permease [Mesomycoplasma molare]UWD34263.1 amino acid permease [Mesomycoplasma molare]